jgi:hypothetical protein
VAQVHEWGGVFTDIVTYSHFRQFRPGLRIAINSHGGHYWSTQVGLALYLPRRTETSIAVNCHWAPQRLFGPCMCRMEMH